MKLRHVLWFHGTLLCCLAKAHTGIDASVFVNMYLGATREFLNNKRHGMVLTHIARYRTYKHHYGIVVQSERYWPRMEKNSRNLTMSTFWFQNGSDRELVPKWTCSSLPAAQRNVFWDPYQREGWISEAWHPTFRSSMVTKCICWVVIKITLCFLKILTASILMFRRSDLLCFLEWKF